ncbi:hypothetical protein EON81_04725 [bacterium]|nr:MAG: hypothetical protein EON81_04725 [bacterium]
MKTAIQISSLALGIVLLAGCGGSSSSGVSTPEEGGSFGQIDTRGQINGTPIVRDLSRITTVALAGTLTDATYRPQGTPDNDTAIAFANYSTIETLSPSGESIETWRPSSGVANESYRYPVWTLDGSRLYYFTPSGIYYTTPAAPTVGTQLIALTDVGLICLSPDGTKICYSRIPGGETDYEVFVRDVAGGATKRLTNNAESDASYCWIDNDRVAILYGASGVGTKLVNVSTLATVPYDPIKDGLTPVARTPDGVHFLNSIAKNDATYGLSVSQKVTDTLYGTADFLQPNSYNANLGGSISPDGKVWACSGTAGLFLTELQPQSARVIRIHGTSASFGVSWLPALGVTRFVGASGKLGSTSAGIVATRRTGPGRNGLSSFVSWDCQTRSTSTVSDDPADLGTGAKTYTIEADRLTALKYINKPFFNAVNTVSASGTANGAIVSLDTENGVVQSIVVFQETRGAKPSVQKQGGRRVIEGSILSVWDAKGKDLAPQGATRVTLDENGLPTVG